MAERKTSLIMLVLLGVLVFVYQLGLGIYHAHGVEPLPTFQFLYTAGFLCGIVWWLKAETGMSPVTSVYCPGLLVSLGWLIVVPYHLVKTRGLRGLLPFLALLGIAVVTRTVAEIVYALSSMR